MYIKDELFYELVEARNRMTKLINQIEGLKSKLDLSELVSIACQQTDRDYEDITSKSRVTPLPDYRRLIWKLLNKDFGYKQEDIIQVFQGVNRSSVSSGIIRITELLEFDTELKVLYGKMSNEVEKYVYEKTNRKKGEVKK